MNAPCQEKIWSAAGPDHGPEKRGSVMVMVGSLYGLKNGPARNKCGNQNNYCYLPGLQALHDLNAVISSERRRGGGEEIGPQNGGSEALGWTAG